MKICLIALFCFCILRGTSQNAKSSLKIGDSIPDIEFTFLDGSSKKLSEFREHKLIILDFWATWCSACIRGLSQADSLQKLFGNRIAIILVNSKNRVKPDSRESVKRFYDTWLRKYPDFSLPFAVEDTAAFSIFPVNAIPQFLWLSPNLKVIAITKKSELTERNIIDAISNLN